MMVRTNQTGIRDEKSWWERNWVWVLVVGIVLILTVFAGTIVGGVMYWFRNSVPFQRAMDRVNQHTASRRLLGSPVTAGWIVTGNLSVSADGGGHARLQIPVSGPTGSGNLVVVAEKTSAQGWSFRVLKLVPDGDRTPIDLLEKPASREAHRPDRDPRETRSIPRTGYAALSRASPAPTHALCLGILCPGTVQVVSRCFSWREPTRRRIVLRGMKRTI